MSARDLDRLSHSRALWNRKALDLRSDKMLAQILDRGDMEDWRALYRMAQQDGELRRRIVRLVGSVPLPLPRFWLAAMASLGESVDWSAQPPAYEQAGI